MKNQIEIHGFITNDSGESVTHEQYEAFSKLFHEWIDENESMTFIGSLKIIGEV